jgi:hypothetical protein
MRLTHVALCAAAVLTTGSARANEAGGFEERHGDWVALFSAAFGAGRGTVSTSGAAASGGANGTTGRVRLAIEITPDLLVGIDYDFLLRHVLDASPYLSNVVPSVIYYPASSLGWYTRVGPGLLIYQEDPKGAARHGVSLAVGTGYEFVVSRNLKVMPAGLSLAIEANYAIGRANGATCSTLSGVGVASLLF